jgi:glycosyltransferase involved in cell wall biosynthesis
VPSFFLEEAERATEVWVPSNFNREIFVRAGIPAGKIYVIPPPVSALPEGAPVASSKPRSDGAPFTFLSVFRWQLRKGWDALVEAFVSEFNATEAVRLVLKTTPFSRLDPDVPASQLSTHMARFGGRGSSPAVELITHDFDRQQLLAMYRAADAFVLPTRGEGWCLPLTEAMSAGLPCIATGWGGHLDYLNRDNGYLVNFDLRPVSDEAAQEWPLFTGHNWAEPSIPHLRDLMRKVFERRRESLQKGKLAQQSLLRATADDTVVRSMEMRIAELTRPMFDRPLRSGARWTHEGHRT